MARESERVALLRRKLGTRLQLARSAAGLTQGQLAVAAFRDRTTVAHIEKGRLRADERFWAAADRACGTDGALVSAYAEVQATKASEELAQHETALADAQAQLDRLDSLDAASDRTAAENRALARLDAVLADVPSAWAALEWLDRAAGWSPGAARRAVAARFASVDVGQLRDLAMHRGRVRQSQVAEVLRSYYGGSVDGYGTYGVTVDGVTVGTSVVTRPEWLDLGCVLSPETDRLRFSASLSAPAVRLDEFGADRAVDRLAETLAIDTRLIDLPLYWLADLDVSRGKVAGQLGVTQFAHFGLTLDLLEGELFGAIATGSPEKLPLRDKYLPDLSSVVDFSRRLCVGGAVAVCAIARPSGPYGQADYLILAQRRSSHVINAARRLALIPRGFHQPLADHREDARITVTLLREMEEELFGRDDVDNTSGDQRCADPMHPSRLSEPMSWLLDHADRLRLECTGIGLNTVNGNYDLACLIVIEDEQFWTRFGGLIEANWESSSLHRYSSRDPESIAELVTDEAWTVDGPFALTQGLRRLATISSNRVDLPNITRSLT